MAIGQYSQYAGVLITCVVFIDSRRRMENIIKLIPMLVKSERVFWMMCAKYIAFLLAETALLYVAEKTVLSKSYDPTAN